jgi:hypothetical protein
MSPLKRSKDYSRRTTELLIETSGENLGGMFQNTGLRSAMRVVTTEAGTASALSAGEEAGMEDALEVVSGNRTGGALWAGIGMAGAAGSSMITARLHEAMIATRHFPTGLGQAGIHAAGVAIAGNDQSWRRWECLR